MDKPLPEVLRSLLEQVLALLSSGQAEQALRTAEDGMVHFSDSADLANMAGICAATLGHHALAEQYWRQTIALDPNTAQPYFNLGLLNANLKRDDEAEQYYRQAIARHPGNAMAHFNLGVILANHQRDAEAEQCYRQTIAFDPGNAAAFYNLGIVLARNHRYDDAERYYRQAIAFEPDFSVAQSSLGILLVDLKREAEAEHCLRRAIALNPDNAAARLNLGLLLLRQSRFEEGWPYYEARYSPDIPDQIQDPYPINVPFAQWRGESLAGKSLLVWQEQGLGDEIQFCRYLPLLKEQGAARITQICKAPLKSLMGTLEGVDTVMTCDETSNVATHDYWIRLLSIPLYCKTDLAGIPARIPYLHASPDRMAHWSGRLPQSGFRVGLVWKGSGKHPNESNRSLQGLAALAPLWSVPGVKFVSLQKGLGEDEGKNPPNEQPLVHLGSEIADFADVAAIVAQLDLVITIDTAVAHLAGALAKPCWVLLPASRTDWRWLHERQDSPWYPGVMRLFRQRDRQDWTALIMDLRQALADEIAKHRAYS
jgi:tetratricopeptide (TPR) repeat protein